MCELFAMSSRQPGRVCFAFSEFVRHGAPSSANPDGWGAAYYDGVDAHLLREPVPATTSAFARVLEHHRFPSPMVLAHVRHASRGPVTLANTQPFARPLGGRLHVFAHNGDLPDIETALPLAPGCFQPIGQTDSEHAFAVLLTALAPLWASPGGIPTPAARLAVLAVFAARLRAIGVANFLYSDGDLLFGHAHRRRHPDGIHPPGLHLLLRGEGARHHPLIGGVSLETESAIAHPLALLASVPLTGESWRPLPEGGLVALAHGRLIAEA
ncbi:MAG: class II glutamine amidotransferase [Rhodospirillales bacterium]|nr:class II glutamine amidotransferase [Rhodospirillales bacterium]